MGTGRVKAKHDDNTVGPSLTERLLSASYYSKCFYMRQFNAFIKPYGVVAIITPILKMGKSRCRMVKRQSGLPRREPGCSNTWISHTGDWGRWAELEKAGEELALEDTACGCGYVQTQTVMSWRSSIVPAHLAGHQPRYAEAPGGVQYWCA